MPGEHALLAPSSASRWLACPPSARLEEKFPEEEESIYAAEGTLCHDISELLIKAGTPYLDLTVWQKFKKHTLYTESLYEYACDYAKYVRSFIPDDDTPYRLYAEKKLILARWIRESFGRGDSALVTGNILHVFDLKFGKGVLVPYLNNKQLRIYGLGWLQELDLLFDIKEIHMHIYQPRMDNIGYDIISRSDLLAWGKNELKPQADIAFEGKGEFKAGDHCGFCKAKLRCKALHNYNMELAAIQFQDPNLLTDAELAKVLERKALFEKWIKAVADYMLTQATNKGVAWPGFKLVEGRADRKYSDEEKVADVLSKQLFRNDIWKPKELLGITELSALIGSTHFKKYVAPLLIKPQGKPTLVPESDARPVFNSASEAFNTPYVESWMK